MIEITEDSPMETPISPYLGLSPKDDPLSPVDWYKEEIREIPIPKGG